MGGWLTAYDVIKNELTPPGARPSATTEIPIGMPVKGSTAPPDAYTMLDYFEWSQLTCWEKESLGVIDGRMLRGNLPM